MLASGAGIAVAGAAGLTLTLKGWVDGKVAQQDKQALLDWQEVIRLNVALRGQSAAEIVSMYQTSEGDNTLLYWQVAGKGGIGWIDNKNSRAYWHSDASFKPARCKYHILQRESAAKGGTALSEKTITKNGSP